MKSERVLVLAAGPPSVSSSALVTILESYFSVVAPAGQEPLGASSSSDLDGELHTAIERYEPSLIFLVSSKDMLAASRKVLASIKRNAWNLPLIVALNGCTPDVAFDLLKLGADDFVTAPFQAID